MTKVRLLLLGALTAGALAVPAHTASAQTLVCIGSVNGEGNTCIDSQDIPVVKKILP